MSVPIEVSTSASGSAWVSDLVLRDAVLGVADVLNSGSGFESGLPKRTSMTSPSTTVSRSLRVTLGSYVGKVSRASLTNRFSQSK